MNATVEILEVSPRDGLQNEKTILSTEDKVELVDRAVRHFGGAAAALGRAADALLTVPVVAAVRGFSAASASTEVGSRTRISPRAPSISSRCGT